MIENMFASTTRTRVSKWILVGSILALVGILAIGFNGILGMNQLRALVADGFNYSFVEARDSMELRQNLLQMRNRMQQIALLDDPERIAQLTIEINQLALQADLLVLKLAELRPEIARSANDVQTRLRNYAELRMQIFTLHQQGRRDEARSLIAGAGSDAFEQVDAMMAAMASQSARHAEGFAREAEHQGEARASYASILLTGLTAS